MGLNSNMQLMYGKKPSYLHPVKRHKYNKLIKQRVAFRKQGYDPDTYALHLEAKQARDQLIESIVLMLIDD